MKELWEKIKKHVVDQVIRVESEFLGAKGSEKRDTVIARVAGLIDIPYLPGVIEDPLKQALIGYLVDVMVDKVNWFTGYNFAGKEISEKARTQLAAAAEAPLPDVVRAIASAGPGASVDDRIQALYDRYGITVREEAVKEFPQQRETIQQEAPPTAQAVQRVSYQWDKILSFVLKYEGGYSNHPDDKGGETNRGITKATLEAAYAQGLVSHNVVRDITREDASKIYAARYYLCYGYDKLPFSVSLAVTDTTVNHGRGGAAKIVQRALLSFGAKLEADGKWGPKTQEAVDKAASESPSQLARLILLKRKNYYDDIISSNPSQATFKNGWYNRLKALAAEAGVESPV